MTTDGIGALLTFIKDLMSAPQSYDRQHGASPSPTNYKYYYLLYSVVELQV